MFYGTTIVAVKKNNSVAIAGDGQVTFGQTTIMKHQAKKVRKLYHGKCGVCPGIDAFTLFEHFEGKIENWKFKRAAVELAKFVR